jgi:transcriptional regulator GlxA family with amidase domain
VTHWAHARRLRSFAGVSVDPNASYVVDGEVWTSAGVTTGIDMALAMVEGYYGAALAGDIAKRLVVYARRPGHQNQFSALLSALVLVAQVGMDPRRLNAAFEGRFGMSAQLYRTMHAQS